VLWLPGGVEEQELVNTITPIKFTNIMGKPHMLTKFLFLERTFEYVATRLIKGILLMPLSSGGLQLESSYSQPLDGDKDEKDALYSASGNQLSSSSTAFLRQNTTTVSNQPVSRQSVVIPIGSSNRLAIVQNAPIQWL
jgi:hypothetical protein